MWEVYRNIARRYPRISLQEERRIIRQAKRGSQEKTEELVLRHISFVIFRIHKRAFPTYVRRFGEDLLLQAIPVLYQKINTYNLRYKDRNGKFKPVRFVSYIWKCIDGMILTSLKREIKNEKIIGCLSEGDWSVKGYKPNLQQNDGRNSFFINDDLK